MKITLKTLCLILGAGACALPFVRAADEPAAPPAAPNAEHAPGDGPGGKWGERAQKRQLHLIKALGLTADQQSKWTALNQQEAADAKAVWADPSLDKDQKREKFHAIRKSYEGLLAANTVTAVTFANTHYETAGNLSAGWGDFTLGLSPKSGGDPVTLSGRFSVIARNEAGTWVYVVDHASAHPASPEPR